MLFRSAAHRPAVVIDDHVYGSWPGADASQKARNWLIDNYQDEGIDYVLLVGDPRTEAATDLVPDYSLPALEIHYNGGTEPTPKLAHTDRWFADLDASHNWDLDGDGLWGEWLGDYLDNTANLVPQFGGVHLASDVYVGRIPIYGNSADDLAEIRQYFESAKWFMVAENLQPWRKHALFAGALLRFYDERRTT